MNAALDFPESHWTENVCMAQFLTNLVLAVMNVALTFHFFFLVYS